MNDQRHHDRRAHYRLRYPVVERPSARVGGRVYQVTEISEGGARLLLDGSVMAPGDAVAAVIRFHDGETLPINGVVLRIDRSEAVVKLSAGISLSRMLVEQQYLLARHPHFFGQPELGAGPGPAGG